MAGSEPLVATEIFVHNHNVPVFIPEKGVHDITVMSLTLKLTQETLSLKESSYKLLQSYSNSDDAKNLLTTAENRLLNIPTFL